MAILPIIDSGSANHNTYHGQEYLGIYPYITKDLGTDNQEHLWATESETRYCRLDRWMKGKPIKAHPKA